VQRAAIMASGCQIAEADICFEDVLPEDLCQKAAASNGAQLLDGDLKAREKQLIVDALNAVNGCRKDAAERLGISPRTLRYKLARLKEQGVAIPATG
jgi:two-component system response regulator FlrC